MGGTGFGISGGDIADLKISANGSRIFPEELTG
jgi:hypothetical protein